MHVRKELLERELKKLGFRKGGTETASHASGRTQQQQQPQSSSHPQADSHSSDHSE